MKKTLKRFGPESLLACAASAMSALHKFGAEDGPPAKKSLCFIKRSEGGDQELDSGGPGVQTTDGTKKALDGKKAVMAKCGTSGTKSPSASGGIYTEHGIGVRSKKSGIDGKAPLAPLSLAHAAAMAASKAGVLGVLRTS